MVAFNNAQLEAFFSNVGQMGLPPQVRERLSTEGLTTIDNFKDFKDDELQAAFKNMRTSIPGLPAVLKQLNARGNIIADAVLAIPGILPYLTSARCALRLKIASNAWHYYTSIGRDINLANMNYNTVLKGFHIE